MSGSSRWIVTVVLALIVGFVYAPPAQAQEKILIKFKLFDTNAPESKTPIDARPVALLSVRDRTTKLPAFPQNVAVTKVEGDFYQVQVDPDVLIEHLVIEVVGTRFSPADVTKVVTKAPITLYPGVSNSEDEFSFSAYGAQMNNYRAIITDLNTALPDRRNDIRDLLGAKFKTQLENMAQAAKDPKRLLTNDPKENAAARQLADEVLRLYGLRPDAPPPPPPPTRVVIVRQYITYYSPPRCRLFSRFRR